MPLTPESRPWPLRFVLGRGVGAEQTFVLLTRPPVFRFGVQSKKEGRQCGLPVRCGQQIFFQNIGCGPSRPAGSRRSGRWSRAPRRGSKALRLRPQLTRGAAPSANSSQQGFLEVREFRTHKRTYTTAPMPARPVEGRSRGVGSCSGKVQSTESGRCFHSPHQPTSSVGGDRKFPIHGNPKFLTFGLSFKVRRAALLEGWQSGTWRADVRMGGPEVVEALSGPGRLEDGVVEALRGEPPDNPPLDRDGDLKPVCGVFAAAAGGAQAGSLQGDHRRASRGVPEIAGEAAVRRGPRGGLSGRVQARPGVCPCDTATRAGRPVRDAGFGCHESSSRERELYSTAFYGDLPSFRLVSPRRAMRVVD